MRTTVFVKVYRHFEPKYETVRAKAIELFGEERHERWIHRRVNESEYYLLGKDKTNDFILTGERYIAFDFTDKTDAMTFRLHIPCTIVLT